MHNTMESLQFDMYIDLNKKQIDWHYNNIIVQGI